jgi:SecD/SecF fusion protein
MNKTAVILLIGGVAFAMFLLVAAVACFLFLPQILDFVTPARGPVLVYEVDPAGLSPGQQVDMANLVKAIDRRFGVGRSRLARVRRMDDRRLEVAVMGKAESDKQRVEKLLASIGTLEFRILANRRDNRDLIERSLADPSKTKLQDNTGNLLAWWAPVKAGQESGLANSSSDIALRNRKKGGKETTEVLVLNDEYNVTGAYLTRVDAGVDERGRPCITFGFNSAGGQLFGELTGSHLPDKVTGFSHKLAIMVDGEVYSAPSIQSAIYDGGQITGSFTNEEVQDLVNVLNAGSLPARIRPVEK